MRMRLFVLLTSIFCLLPLAVRSQSCTQAPTGLVAWWPGDGDFSDIKGTNAATNVGGVTFANGKVDQAFHFSGASDSYLILPNSPELSPPTAITIAAWMKPDLAANNLQDSVLIKRSGCGSQRSYQLSLNKLPFPSSEFPGNTMAIGTVVWSASVAGDDLESATLFPMDGDYHHVAGTYDGSKMRVYIDGVLAGEKTHIGPIPSSSDAPVMGINAACGHLTYGDIDEVQLYNHALSESEVNALFASGIHGQCKGKYLATVQQPIDQNGSSVFNSQRGVVPVKFSLGVDGAPTCQLPAAIIALSRTVNNALQPISESEYIMPADSGSNFRIDGCQYIYNLATSSLGPGAYVVEVRVDGNRVGLANFALK